MQWFENQLLTKDITFKFYSQYVSIAFTYVFINQSLTNGQNWLLKILIQLRLITKVPNKTLFQKSKKILTWNGRKLDFVCNESFYLKFIKVIYVMNSKR